MNSQQILSNVFGLRINGGPGSGNFGHEGRPGEVGGSGGGGSEGDSDPHISSLLKKGQEDQFMNSLSSEERIAISEYKGEDPYAPGAAIALNGMLRAGEKLSDAQKSALEKLDSAFRKAPRLSKGTTLYRGTSEPMEFDRDGYLKDTKAFISTTTDKSKAQEFSSYMGGSNTSMYEIHAPKNLTVLPTRQFLKGESSISEEKELLLPRGLSIKRVGSHDNVTILEVMGGSAWMLKDVK